MLGLGADLQCILVFTVAVCSCYNASATTSRIKIPKIAVKLKVIATNS